MPDFEIKVDGLLKRIAYPKAMPATYTDSENISLTWSYFSDGITALKYDQVSEIISESV